MTFLVKITLLITILTCEAAALVSSPRASAPGTGAGTGSLSESLEANRRVHGRAPYGSPTLEPDQIQALKSVIWSSIHTKHHPDGVSTFDGSYDWHSDVHAYWALLSIARVTKDRSLEDRMRSMLTIERLEHEYAFLSSPGWQDFEKPYGRTWFLLLLWELNKRPIAKDGRFQKIRWAMTTEILSWLQAAPFPEFGRELIGTHDSWLMSFFLLDLAKSENPRLRRALAELVETKIRLVTSLIEKKPMDADDFLYLPALKYLAAPNHRYEKPIVPIPVSAAFACHYPGAVQVSLWAYAGQCARGDKRACEVARSTTQSFVAQTKLWKEDFDCISHWVPQFVWMTNWLSSGRP